MHARAQITAMWYDALDRPTDTVQFATYGLNDGGPSSFNRYSGMSSAPSRSDTVLVTSTTYNKDGTVLEVADPKNLKTHYLYDPSGRQVAVISNYTGTFTGSTEDRDHDTYVRYKYANGLMTYMWVDMQGDDTTGAVPTALSGADANDQITEYVYGTTKGTTLGGGSPPQSLIASGQLLREAIYPPQTPSQAESERTVYSAYNALSEQVWAKNQNGTTIRTTLDLGGRETARIVDAVGTDVNGWVKRVELGYTDRGQVQSVTQYDNTSGGTALNGVKYTYDEWGNITNIEQDRDSAVGSGTPYSVSFAYSLQTPSTGRQRVQRTSMSLPVLVPIGPSTTAPYEVDYLYQGGTGSSPTKLDQLIGRVSGFGINDDKVALVSYQYLGSADLVGNTYTEFTSNTGTYRHTNVSNAAYDALDTFNRVTIDRWQANGGTPYKLNLAYDRNSNITQAEDPNIINGSSGTTLYHPYTTQYTMDGLNRVTTANRGNLSSGSIVGDTRLKETWLLTQTGNWSKNGRFINSDTDAADSSSAGVWSIPELQDERTNNHVNEIGERDMDGAIVSNTPTTFTAWHDLAGQMVDDGKDRGFQYDAFGRLVEVRKVLTRNSTTGKIATYSVMAEYRYDGLGQRTAWHRDFDADGTAESTEKWLYLVYDDRWRAIAIYHQDDPVTEVKEIPVPNNAGLDGRGGSSYIDSYALRENDATKPYLDGYESESDGALESRQYYLQNWRADLVSMIGEDGVFPGWFKYSAYGQHQWISAADIDGGSVDGFRDGVVNGDDSDAFNKTWFEAGDLRADVNYDGAVTTDDLAAFLAVSATDGNAPLNATHQGRRIQADGAIILHPISSAFS